PDGLRYVSSWVDLEFRRCFQVMEAESDALFAEWTAHWDDLIEFEIVPVRTSAEAAASIAAEPRHKGRSCKLLRCSEVQTGPCKSLPSSHVARRLKISERRRPALVYFSGWNVLIAVSFSRLRSPG